MHVFLPWAAIFSSYQNEKALNILCILIFSFLQPLQGFLLVFWKDTLGGKKKTWPLCLPWSWKLIPVYNLKSMENIPLFVLELVGHQGDPLSKLKHWYKVNCILEITQNSLQRNILQSRESLNCGRVQL